MRGGIDIVDAISQSQQFRMGHSVPFRTALHKFQAKYVLSESPARRQQSSLNEIIFNKVNRQAKPSSIPLAEE